MSKFPRHKNVKRKGSSSATVRNTTERKKKPDRARKIATEGTDVVETITDNPLYLLAYTVAAMALMYIIKIIIQ